MGTGIIICGLNGAGKSTLGKALAENCNFYFIDNEELYFPQKDAHYLYAAPCTREEAKKLLLSEMEAHNNFIYAAVKGDFGEAVASHFRYAILVQVPKEIRLQRVKDRSFQKFGNRMLSGGDLYEREQAFFQFVQSRTENTVEEWVQSLGCPVIRVDGTKPIEENVNFIRNNIKIR